MTVHRRKALAFMLSASLNPIALASFAATQRAPALLADLKRAVVFVHAQLVAISRLRLCVHGLHRRIIFRPEALLPGFALHICMPVKYSRCALTLQIPIKPGAFISDGILSGRRISSGVIYPSDTFHTPAPARCSGGASHIFPALMLFRLQFRAEHGVIFTHPFGMRRGLVWFAIHLAFLCATGPNILIAHQAPLVKLSR